MFLVLHLSIVMPPSSPHPGLLPRAVDKFQAVLKSEVKLRESSPRARNRLSKIILFEDVTAKVFVIVNVCVHLARFNCAMFKCITVKTNENDVVLEECNEFAARKLTQHACKTFKMLCEVNLTLWPHVFPRPFRTTCNLRHVVHYTSLRPLCTWHGVGFTRHDKKSLEMLLKPSVTYITEMQLALVMAFHPRLGSTSCIRVLSVDNIRYTFDRLTTIASTCPTGEYLLRTKMPTARGMKTRAEQCRVRMQEAAQAPELETERDKERMLKKLTFLRWKRAIGSG